jgi:hypothetical protein
VIVKKLISFAATVVGGLALTVGSSAAPAASHGAFHCGPAQFTADIRKGPDRDLSLAGSLSIDVASSGRVQGTLVHYGKQLSVTGKAHGRSFKLVFHLRSGRSMAGVGVATRTIATCHDVPTTGVATGPRRGDKGVWGYALGG